MRILPCYLLIFVTCCPGPGCGPGPGEAARRRAAERPLPADPGDEDTPAVWLRKLARARTELARRIALVNLHRIHEVRRKLPVGERARRLAAFRSEVAPALVAAYRRREAGRVVLGPMILELLVTLKARGPQVEALYRELLASPGTPALHGGGDAPDRVLYWTQRGVMELLGRRPPPIALLPALASLWERRCRQAEGLYKLDPDSGLRSRLVTLLPALRQAGASPPVLARILTSLLGCAERAVPGVAGTSEQDPLVTILAIRALGELGVGTPAVADALTLAMYAKGRGRRFFSFAATALAKLPADAQGRHPALGGLLHLVRGDPWKGALPRAKPRTMPRCPLPRRYAPLCALFWRAHVEQWESTEPGVIELNALLALRELGDPVGLAALVGRYGVAPTRRRWLAQARAMPGLGSTRDRELPGVVMQKMVIGTYGRDMSLRALMLHAVGRASRGKLPAAIRQELQRSLTWSGDPVMTLQAAEGAAWAPYDPTLAAALVRQIRRSASPMTVTFVKRMVRPFFFGLATKGRCEANQALEEELLSCLKSPPGGPGRGATTNANWRCMRRFQKVWLTELRYAVGYHLPGDLARLVHPRCQKQDDWWNRVRPGLAKRARKGDQAARRALYACQRGGRARAGKGSGARPCGVWKVCDASNGYLCLDGHWQMRLELHRTASLLATPKEAPTLLGVRPKDLMRAHGLRVAGLPRKGRSAFYDPDDALLLTRSLWDPALERARLRKAREVLGRRLCRHRRYLWVVKRCGRDVKCYAAVARGDAAARLPWEDCDAGGVGRRRTPTRTRAPGWEARLKALRMLAMLGAAAGPRSPLAALALRTAVEQYGPAGKLPRAEMQSLRRMILLVVDRVADPAHHRGLACGDGERPGRKRGCFRLLKRIVESETARRVEGAWQVNREAAGALGRYARRAGLAYDRL